MAKKKIIRHSTRNWRDKPGTPLSMEHLEVGAEIHHTAVIQGAILKPARYLRSVDYMGLGVSVHGYPYDVERETGEKRNTTIIRWNTKKV